MKMETNLCIQDALVQAICVCPQSKTQLMTMVEEGDNAITGQNQILIYVSTANQQFKSILKSIDGDLHCQTRFCTLSGS